MILAKMDWHTSLRLAEIAFALLAVGGAGVAFGAVVPMGRKPGSLVGGLALLLGGVLLVVDAHWGTYL